MKSRSRRVRQLLLLAGACAAAGGCSVQRVPLKDPAGQAATAGNAPYDFQKEKPSPPAPAAGTASEPAPTLDTPEATDLGAPGVTVQDLPAPPAPAAGQPAPGAAAPPAANGFRVQILATTDAAAADKARADAETRLGLRAYVRFESPYYKVRVGNCATNDDCQRLQDQLRAAGFATVWVVPETIER